MHDTQPRIYVVDFNPPMKKRRITAEEMLSGFGKAADIVTEADLRRLKRQAAKCRRAVRAVIRLYRKSRRGAGGANIIYISKAEEAAHLRDVLLSRLEVYRAAQREYCRAVKNCIK
ncbi:MAG: hypothetical protein EA357_06375 [Micavibrio sp.]|nr:MAG: hypothetical protein EA357_06375 [Micavibrio sp.]